MPRLCSVGASAPRAFSFNFQLLTFDFLLLTSFPRPPQSSPAPSNTPPPSPVAPAHTPPTPHRESPCICHSYENNRGVYQPFPIWNSLLVLGGDPRCFFSCTYKLPIFYPLCFDIHASDGGCRGSCRAFFSSRADPTGSGARITFRAVPYLLSSLPHYLIASLPHCFFMSSWPDHKNNPLPPPERRKEVQHLLPGSILFVEQLHPVFRFRGRNNFCSRFHPIAQQLAACGARRNSHAWIVSDAFHFSGNADRVHEKFRVARIEPRRRIRRKPYRRLHAFAAFFESFEVQILVPCKRLKSHRLAPSNSVQGILRRTQKLLTDIPVCPRGSRSPFMRRANTKSTPIQ